MPRTEESILREVARSDAEAALLSCRIRSLAADLAPRVIGGGLFSGAAF